MVAEVADKNENDDEDEDMEPVVVVLVACFDMAQGEEGQRVAADERMEKEMGARIAGLHLVVEVDFVDSLHLVVASWGN